MKNFLVRSASAIVYAGLLIAGCLWWSPMLYLTLGFLLVTGQHELKKLMGTDISMGMMLAWNLVCLLLLTAGIAMFDEGLLFDKGDDYSYAFLVIFSPLIITFLVVVFSTLSHKPVRGLLSYFSVSLIYLVIPMMFAIGLQGFEISEGFSWLLVLLAAIWINDTMAYITGSLIGKHKLFERVSPGKTWEGFFGGLIFTIATLLIINNIFFDFDIISLGIFALVIVLSSTTGDLLESKLKREAGVKDSGSIIPGHGGVLDRIDSLLVAAPFMGIALIVNDIITNWH